MIDKQTLLERIDLLNLIGGNFHRAASTGGGEWEGPCPFCPDHGRDRFRIQPNNKPWGLWMCRHCTDGKWKNAIDYVIRRDSCDFKTALLTLGGQDLPAISRPIAKYIPEPEPAYSPPPEDWQETANQAIAICQDNLLFKDQGKKALEYLYKRGLKEKTIKRFLLGFSPGVKVGGLYIPRGIVIPCVVSGEVWYLKIRTNSIDQGKKYLGVKGNRTNAIFNAGDLISATPALFCEGEFDCMIAWQEIGDVVIPITLGAAKNKPDLASWGPYLIDVNLFMFTYDNDEAGRDGALAVMDVLGDRAKLALLPEEYKDINDYFLAGNDLWKWIQPYLEFYDPIKTAPLVEAN